jgi:hypothetical protein
MKRQAFLLLCSLSFALGCDIPDGDDDDYGDCDDSDEGTTDPSETGTDTSADGTEEGCDTSTTDGGVVNGCGVFDPDMHDQSTIPQDPDDPEILTACTALCDAQTGGIEGCATSAEACLEDCKMRSCDVCPGTLAPLVDCETAMFTGEGCSCEVEGIDCPVPAGCSEVEQQTGFCGG